MKQEELLRMCEDAYTRFHKPEYIDPDPLVVVREQSSEDREVAAFLVAGLALGRVQGILSVSRKLMAVLGGHGKIRKTLLVAGPKDLLQLTRALTWRFFDGRAIGRYCFAIGEICRRWGSLESCFLEGCRKLNGFRAGGPEGLRPFRESKTVRGLSYLRTQLRSSVDLLDPMIFPDPKASGAQKRLHLCLRWLVRADVVDLGIWKGISPADLWVPIDTHMLRHCRSLGLTERNTADVRAVVEVSDAFRTISPSDPVKYDFCLSRMGIHPVAATHEIQFYSGQS